MKCPGCGAAVEEGADLCLECGEPIGDSPAAVLARAESKPAEPPRSAVAPPTPNDAARVRPAGARSVHKTLAAAPRALKRSTREEEPELVRCPGCGAKSSGARCPGCGTPLKHDAG